MKIIVKSWKAIVALVVPAAVILGVTLVSIANSGTDEEQWRADVEDYHGFTIADWPTYKDTWQDTCDQDNGTFGMWVSTFLDEGETPESIRINIKHACPERLDHLEYVYDVLGQ